MLKKLHFQNIFNALTLQNCNSNSCPDSNPGNSNIHNEGINTFRNESNKPKLKSLIIFLALLFSITRVSGQVSNYSFGSSSGTYTAISGGTLLSNTGVVNDDNTYSAVPIGFSFVYNGTSYTTLGISANGYMQFGGTAPANYYDGTSIQNLASAIHPFSEDLYGTSATCEIQYNVTGSTGSRIFTIQWKDWGFYSGGGSQINFQAKLYEGSNTIQFIYQPIAQTTSQTVQAGLTGTTVSDYKSRTTTTNWSSTTASTANTNQLTWSTTVFPANGLTYTWSPPPA